jgi:ATP-dependent Lon protease
MKKFSKKRTAETQTDDFYKEDLVDTLKPIVEKITESRVLSSFKTLAEMLKEQPPTKRRKTELQITDEPVEELPEDEEELSEEEYTESEEDETEEEYFNKLPEEKQKEIKEIEDTVKNMIKDTDKPTKYYILELPVDIKTKYQALNKWETMETMDPTSSEYSKYYRWFDAFMKIPFGKYINLPVSEKNNTNGEIINYLTIIKEKLDECVYGNNEPKDTILEILAQWISNPESTAQVLGFEGPAGTGKTSLARFGIANALNRPFFQINLGGSNEGSSIGGSNIVYEGSTYGDIVRILIEAQCMNPVIYFDELDKVSRSPQGREIIGLLTHITDYSQNTTYRDKYLDIDLDLSKALFIFSYNEPEKIDPILKDRLKIIMMNGYKQDEKLIISRMYLLPDILRNINNSNIVFPDEILRSLISRYSPSESGVREIRRVLEKIVMKVNYLRFSNPEFLEKYKVDDNIVINDEIISKCITSLKRVESAKFNSMYL